MVSISGIVEEFNTVEAQSAELEDKILEVCEIVSVFKFVYLC